MSEFNVENFSSAAGNYIFALVKGTERYSLHHAMLKIFLLLQEIIFLLQLKAQKAIHFIMSEFNVEKFSSAAGNYIFAAVKACAQRAIHFYKHCYKMISTSFLKTPGLKFVEESRTAYPHWKRHEGITC